MSTPHPTQSHLLNRLLQRHISQLESENATLKARVATLEERVTDSTAKHRALNGGVSDDITRATAASQAVSRETERTAKLMVQQWRQAEPRLREVAHNSHHAQERLVAAIAEFYSTLDTLQSHATRDVALTVREAHRRQEQLMAQLSELYDVHGLLRHPDTKSRIMARRIEAEADATRQSLTDTLGKTQQSHDAAWQRAHDAGRTVTQLLTTTLETITTLQAELQRPLTPAKGTSTVPPRLAHTAAPPSVQPTTTPPSPLSSDHVLETARRAFADAIPPRPAPQSPAARPVAAIKRMQYDTDTIRILPKNDVVFVPAKSRPFLQIGVMLAAFVVVLVVVASML